MATLVDAPIGVDSAIPVDGAGSVVASQVVVPSRRPSSFGLGTVVHEITAPNADPDSPPLMASWESTEIAPGGFQSMSGQIDADRVLANPRLYRQGARWVSMLAETGDCVGVGSLLRPAISGGMAQLRARGLAYRFDRIAARLIYQSRYYGDWATADSDPYNLAFTNADKFQVDTTGGKLAVSLQQGVAYVVDDEVGIVFAAPAGIASATILPNVLGRIAFTLGGTDANFEWRLRVYTHPNTLVGLEGTTWAATAGTNVDYSVVNAGDMLVLSVRCKANVTPAAPKKLTATALRVNGIAMGGGVGGADLDVFSGSQMMADMAGRIGLSTAAIMSTSESLLPADFKQGTFTPAALYLDLMTGYRHLALSFNGVSDVLDFGPWDRRQWRMIDPEAPVSPDPLEQYDSVLLPFVFNAGSASGQVLVSLNPSPLLEPNVFGDVMLQDPVADEQTAQTLGQSILGWLSQPREAGSGTLMEVLDARGNRRSAHLLHAGDTLYKIDGYPIRIASLRRTADGVSWQGDQRIAALDRLLTWQRQALMLRGLIG